MEILVYGIGGVGGYFGGKLANAGLNVSMIARGEHLKQIQKHGLEVESINGNFKVKLKVATSEISEVPKPDLIILGIKSWQIPAVAKELKSIIGENTMILPLQNGADNVEKLLKILPGKNVLAGLCFVVSFIEKPAKIKHTAFDPKITFGEIDNSQSGRILELKKIFDKAGIDNSIPENIQLEVWKKFMFICTVSGIGGLTRVSIDKIRESDYLFGMMKKSAKEIIEVGKAKGVPLKDTHLEMVFEIINSQPKGNTASTQRDIMNGKPSELYNFNGYIVKEGKKYGIETPVNRYIYECLKPMEEEARKTKE
ncbi:ketopantoate reductase family protein [Christiangramia forsetii]|uniref:2-dehydropantoate 2-reductase n=2 Tax=Christiangramia forsetii TaxID=411153 RepID=A0M5T2_CHRFK|nr:2-dehydropantoate 2-reductase [Christiangramia forsetii]GGG32237.1 2-dehydropantoate 2-reductase [Christiangramia forsetii]CAL67977.1 ketopantoate reductase PanE/ApbA [Christiangramia forsetii KT0803]